MKTPEQYAEMAEAALLADDGETAQVYASLAVAAVIREASSSWREMLIPEADAEGRK